MVDALAPSTQFTMSPAAGERDWDLAHAPVPVLDIARLVDLSGDAITVGLEHTERDGHLHFTLAAVAPVPLRRMLPALQSMDLEVLHQQTATWTRPDGRQCHIYDLTLQPGARADEGLSRRSPDTEERIRDTFHAVWAGRAEADGFNTLTMTAGLSWRQVSVLRSFSRYLRQLPLPYSQGRIQAVLLDNPTAARALIALFEARFAHTERPAHDERRQAAISDAEAVLDAEIARVVHIDADRILRVYRTLIKATDRTNAFAPEALSTSAPYLVHKMRAQDIEELPQPRPLSEIFVYSAEFEGLHLRFGLVARGGLRWSDRHDDYRTEVLGLVKAQAVKNAVIVPAGAKGVFVVKQPVTSQASNAGDANVIRAQGLRCYKHFISALLSVVDTSAPIAGQPTFGGVVRHDGSDPYLVVAADKGTASFSDTANVIALQRNFWLGDAFASGGSAGYDHKSMGITARGAWVSADHHLRTLGIDPLTEEFSAVGIGDMSGDVFGNGMLIRPKVRLIAAFDHRHIFVDPQPQVERAHAERQRLFELSRSSWDDYHRDLISAGGGVWPRTAKTIPVSAQMRAALAIADDVTELTPNQIIGEILRAPVDLVFNGGIGTYVKAAAESHAAVSDKVNDTLRVDARDIRARAIVEGGNLGVSPQGRIEYARSGGLINTDAIDNAAGVDCSDHEVNIKILLELATQHGALNRAERNALLAEMTGEVTELILANNRAHSRLLSDARFNASQMVDVHARMTTALETRRKLIRAIEHLPTATEYTRLAKDGDGLCVPQLATLMAHVKLDLKAELLADDVLDDPHFGATLQEYFPARLRHRLGDALPNHPLRREIIATSIVNHVLATSGLTYAFRLSDETAAATSDIVRAHTIVSKVFDLDSLWSDIYAANLDPTLTNKLIIEGRRLLDRASRWFLLNRPQPLDIDSEISRFAQPVAALRSELSVMLRGDEKAAVTAARQDLLQSGVPALVAQRISEALYAFSLLDIVEIALAHGEDARRIASIYFELSDHVGVDRLLLAVSSLPREDRWHSLARLALREDLYRSLRELALDVARRIAGPGHSDSVIEEFELYNRPRIERARRTLIEFMNTDERDLAVISVASAQLRRLSATQA